MLLASLWLAALAGQDVRATATLDVSTVEVGDPVTIALVLEHPADVHVELLPEALGDAWISLGTGGAATLPDADGGATTRLVWTVCALEPLEAALPAVVVSVDGGAPESVSAGGDALTVVGVLAEGEDAARPARGFRDAPPVERGLPWWVWVVGAAVLLALVALLPVWRRRAPAPVAGLPTPLERLAAVEATSLEEPEAVQAAYYEITAALRAGVDQRLNQSPTECGALTDDEWLEAVAVQLPEAEYDLVADVLRGSEAVKYGSVRPTHWGVNETLERVRSVLTTSGSAAEVVA
jgi:hypothetical protein